MECGECTACCYAFPVVEIEKLFPYTKCEYAKKGCQIYTVRPSVCRKYECAWITQPKAHIDLRPDKCGTIFTKMRDNIILVTPLRKLEAIAQRQIKEFEKQGYTIRHDSSKLHRRFN